MESNSQDKNSLSELLEGRLEALGIKGHGKGKLLAKMAGIPQSTVSRILNGSKQVGTENIYKILRSLNLISTISEQTADEPTRQAMLTVKKIMESKDPYVVPILQANLATFQVVVQTNKEKNAIIEEMARQAEAKNAELNKDVDKLTKKVNYLKEINNPHVPAVASGGSGTTTLPKTT